MKTFQKTILLILLLILSNCADNNAYDSYPPAQRIESYSFDPSKPLHDRIQEPPLAVMDYLIALDKRPDYRPALLDEKELVLCRSAIKALPPHVSAVLRKRLLGIYFIEDFNGSGLTECVADRKGNPYAIMVFNRKALHLTISALLTWKENSAFKTGGGKTSITVQCGDRENAFLYILLHESMHAYDYIVRITPYVDDESRKRFNRSADPTPFTENVWAGYDSPASPLPFSGTLHFYTMDESKQIIVSEAPALYEKLQSSPFISLYSTLSWAEDFAEMGAFYHLTQVLNLPYRINVYGSGGLVKSYTPMNFPRAVARLPFFGALYKTGSIPTNDDLD